MENYPSGASYIDLRTREDLIKEVSELRQRVYQLEELVKNQKREEILKDINEIVECEGISDYVINLIVDYILERENK